MYNVCDTVVVDSDSILGRVVTHVKVCACPGRDATQLEAKLSGQRVDGRTKKTAKDTTKQQQAVVRLDDVPHKRQRVAAEKEEERGQTTTKTTKFVTVGPLDERGRVLQPDDDVYYVKVGQQKHSVHDDDE